MTLSTAYLCDTYSGKENLQIAEPLLKNFGQSLSFSGAISTIKCFEDNAKIKSVLALPGQGRVLVVDGGGSHRCALVDENLAGLAVHNGWQALVIYGCIRHVDALSQIPIGILALHPHPLLCHDKGTGDLDVLLTFAGVNFRKDHFLYADKDGIIVSETILR